MTLLSHLRPFPHRLRICFYFAAALFFVALPAHSQQAQLDALAAQTAQALDKALIKSVVVADFWSPHNEMTELGHSLADQFSASLLNSQHRFEVRDRTRLGEAVKQGRLSPLALQNLGVAQWTARQVQAEAILLGEVRRDSEQYSLDIVMYEEPDGQRIAHYHANFPASAEWDAIFGARLEGDTADAHEAQTKGYSAPTCVYCPMPSVPRTAFPVGGFGRILLSVIVGDDGRTHDIFVEKGLGARADAIAMETVAKWKFKPAIGSDGKPAAVHTVIETSFSVY